MEKPYLTAFIVCVAFAGGVVAAPFLLRHMPSASAEQPEAYVPFVAPMPTSTPVPTIIPRLAAAAEIADAPIPDAPKTSAGRQIIRETSHITASTARVETGEQVDFNVALTNVGDRKKFLTHICFHHSGGETFGCILNKNLYPGETFAFGNSMIFRSPGTYRVWITWSQDGTTWIRPIDGGVATVVVE